MKELLEFLRLADLLEGIPRDSTEETVTEIIGLVGTTIWRRQVFSFSIVQLYGALERFMKDYLQASARTLASLYSTYDDLPERVRIEHARLSAQHIRELAERDPHDGEALIGSMAEFAKALGGQPLLNDVLFAKSTANFRADVTRQSFARLDLVVASVPAEVPDLFVGVHADIEAVIDDLAVRRNIVAHGSDAEVVDTATLRAMIEAVQAFVASTRKQISLQLLKGLVEREAVQLGTVSHTWTNAQTQVRSVARITDLTSPLSRGDVVFARGTGRRWLVRSIQASGQDLDQAEPDDRSYGVDLGTAVPVGTTLVALPDRWAARQVQLLKQAQDS